MYSTVSRTVDFGLDHAAEHAFAARQNQADHHDGQQKEYQT